MAKRKDKYSHFICGGTLIGNPELATILGSMDRAIVLEQIHYYTQVLADSPHNIHEDWYGNKKVWCYNSYEEWKEHDFYWLSARTIERIFTWLEEKELIISMRFNKKGTDQTKWYTIAPGCNEAFDKLAHEKPEIIERIKKAEKKMSVNEDNEPFWPRLSYTLGERQQEEKKERLIERGFIYDEAKDQWTDPEQPGKHWEGTIDDGKWVDDEPKAEAKLDIMSEKVIDANYAEVPEEIDGIDPSDVPF